MAAGPVTAGKIAYGGMFAIALPGALAWWVLRLEPIVALPEGQAAGAGWAIAGLGALLMGWATLVLRVDGGGLPMSAFPPERWVARGPYRALRHPLYVGAVLGAAGLSLAFGADTGLWIV